MSWVLAPSNELLLHFRDDRGKHSTLQCFVANTVTDPTSTGPAAISSTAAAISDSALYETEIRIVAEQSTGATFGTSPYDRPSDKAAYEFNAADGSIVHLQIGAPLAAQFSNAWDVDTSNSLVIALVTQMKAHAVTQEGAAISALGPSHRRRPPRRKIQ